MISVKHLRTKVAIESLRAGGRVKYAAEINVPFTVLRDFMGGRKPSKTLLAALGYEKVTGYKKKAARQEAAVTENTSTTKETRS